MSGVELLSDRTEKGASAYGFPCSAAPFFKRFSLSMPTPSTIAENRRATFDYEFKEKFEAGIELRGNEVKSAKGGHFQIAGSQVLIRGGEAWLVNSHIPPYQPKNTSEGYVEDRARKLLLTTNEIKSVTGVLQDKSRRLIPLRAYLKNGFIKLELGLGSIRRKSDKREALKKRAHIREMRTL
jgi:SsrA-binding protein